MKKITSDLVEEVIAFEHWYQERQAVPYLRELHDQVIEIKEKALSSLERKLPDLTEHQILLIDKHVQSIINQMKRKPIESLKDLARKKSSRDSTKELSFFAKSLGFSVESENAEDTTEVLTAESEENGVENN